MGGWMGWVGGWNVSLGMQGSEEDKLNRLSKGWIDETFRMNTNELTDGLNNQ